MLVSFITGIAIFSIIGFIVVISSHKNHSSNRKSKTESFVVVKKIKNEDIVGTNRFMFKVEDDSFCGCGKKEGFTDSLTWYSVNEGDMVKADYISKDKSVIRFHK